ncbi:MAG: tetratricopeptide repeat protein [Aggregatilineales bacterium]|nr:tetratricopeptide repeat protein [Chloroflexota bacterium]HOA24977.1 tetratricopeptide repeat protein [Aggregatilineales bacterium]HPV07094.1 tetratricopeptide repeat protein [Aggregatilineales bacterium]HQE19451.1 tetratricopeptide repeat protein [Aggregatilineales bacterium]
MYIKREPLGKGNLTFGKRRRRRFSLLFIIVYLTILGSALYVFMNLETFQPKVLAALGPEPTPTLTAEALRELGYERYMAGKLEAAADYYREAARLAPDDLQLQADLARMLTLVNTEESRQEAIAVADQMILTAPEDPRGYAMKARALNWSGDADQSAIEALRAIELDPNMPEARAYLAEAYTDLGQLRQAREEAEKAIALDAFNVDARRNYAYVLEYYGDYGGAISQYRQALQLHPNLLDLWYGIARNYRANGQYDEAVAAFQEIIARTQDDPLPYVGLGRTYFEIREDSSAQQWLERAVQLVCDECPLHTYEELEEMDFEIPESELPEEVYVPAWHRLGMVYHARKNFESAIAIYEELIAWAKVNDVELPIEVYYISAADFYYLDRTADDEPLCNMAVPRAFEALDIYEDTRMDDPNALDNILKVFVLCRDYANTPPTIRFEFPERYEEPDVVLQLPGQGGGNDGEDAESEEGQGGGEAQPTNP